MAKMFGFDFLREIGHKIKDGSHKDEARCCRSVMMSIPQTLPIDIDFKNISFAAKNAKNEKKLILKGVSGKFKSGELTAIMGPSGAGKTSLLNILTGFQMSGASGTISNRECGRRNSNQYKKESCYILQDDRLSPLFTVHEIMTMAANLKLGNNLSKQSKQIIINEVLETLGLNGTKNTRCLKLSGGQKKRLSIALELIDNPPIIFLDEPTTGLDSSASLMCISMLKNLARGGRTIVCTIHQPSASLYEMFDHVYILAEGMCVYQGAATNTVDYLKTFGFECPKYHNPADYILEIANCEYGNFNSILAGRSSEQSWRIDSRAKEVTITPVEERSILSDTCKATVLITPPTEFNRFWILFNRSLIQQHRDWTVTYLKLILNLAVGLILGFTFHECGSHSTKTISNIGFLIIGVVYLTYTTMMPAVLKFPDELPVLKKENFNNWYRLRTYYVAQILCSAPIQLMLATIYSTLAYYFSSQPLELQRFLMYLMVLLLVTLVAEAFGNIFGTILNPVNGTFVGAIFICVMLVYAGFLVQFPHMTVLMRSVSYLSYFRYSLEALMECMYGYDRPKLYCPEDKLYCHFRFPEKVLEDLGMGDVNYWINILILTLCLIVLKCLGFYTLHRKLRKG